LLQPTRLPGDAHNCFFGERLPEGSRTLTSNSCAEPIVGGRQDSLEGARAGNRFATSGWRT
jgi:hypothetical protein